MTMTIVCTRVIDFIVKTDSMYSKPSKSSKGSVEIENFQGQLRLRLPRQLYSGKHKYLMGLADTPENRKEAEKRLRTIELNILW